MKRLAASLLLVLYFAFSAGATVHLHYCMGEFAGFSLTDNHGKDACGKCGMDRHNESDCCKDVQITKKISDPHNAIKAVFHPVVPHIEPPVFYLDPEEKTPARNVTAHYDQYPPGPDTPRFIRFRNLRL